MCLGHGQLLYTKINITFKLTLVRGFLSETQKHILLCVRTINGLVPLTTVSSPVVFVYFLFQSNSVLAAPVVKYHMCEKC